MKRLIDIDTLLKETKKQGIKLGKGNPYNRLRYYTKIGLLPHMERKKTESGTTQGHYPEWVIDRLKEIENFKNAGLSNEEILKKIESSNKLQTFKNTLATPEARTKILTYTSFVLLVFILLVEVGAINIGVNKSKIIDVEQVNQTTPQILASGQSFVPRSRERVFVKAEEVRPNSKVYISFTGDYSPAVRYWVEEINNGHGFYVDLDSPIYTDAEFNWWISN